MVGLLAAVAACGGDDKQAQKGDATPRGGTLRVGVSDDQPASELLSTLDPAKLEFDPPVAELYRCCLLRTLLNYRGATTEAGGSVLRPDLAVALPKVSEDGRTYTFRLKQGLRYAPPYEDVPIKAQDIVRAIEYTLSLEPGYFSSFLLVIEGALEFQSGEADTVSGLETPDDNTLVVHLAEPVGDLPERFSFAYTAPIPPETDVGHKQIGRVPVASGPYMLAGSEGFDFSRSPTKQRLPSGYALNKRVALVRNPAWGNDQLRSAYVDRIVLTLEGPADKAAARVDEGGLDFAIGQLVPTPKQVERYGADPALKKRLFAHVGNTARYINLNVAVPPFDDVHVRKAVNLAIDKESLRRAAHAGLGGRIAGHIAPDALLNNLLLDYDPYETSGHRGDLEAARKEMAKSRYDRNRDGKCDAAACRGLLAPTRSDDPSNARLARIVRDNVRRIGIELDVKAFDPEKYFGDVILPQSRVPVIPALGVAPDTLNAAGVFPSLFYGPLVGSPAGTTLSLVGASPGQLKKWKYTVAKVPNIDDKIAECLRLTAAAQIQCWAETDQLLMETVVPWVPYLFEGGAQVVSNRVARFAFAQSGFVLIPAFDQIALKPGSD
ncbi:MAG: ABC transporter substrate-binding protein [Gaiellaceae bacterium]